MRTLQQNKQKIKYGNLVGSVPVYRLDASGNKIVDYTDESGTVFYQLTGETVNEYTNPQEAMINIAFSGGEAETVEFGVDITAYDATLEYLLNEFPITETSLIWYQTEPTFINTGDLLVVDPASADYKVLSVKPSLNYTRVLLGRLAK